MVICVFHCYLSVANCTIAGVSWCLIQVFTFNLITFLMSHNALFNSPKGKVLCTDSHLLLFQLIWGYNVHEMRYWSMSYPAWAIAIGWVVAFLPIIPLPISMVKIMLQFDGTIIQVHYSWHKITTVLLLKIIQDECSSNTHSIKWVSWNDTTLELLQTTSWILFDR